MPRRTLDSYSGAAVIEQGDQRVSVDCAWEAVQEMVRAGDDLLPGLKEWSGTFTAPPGTLDADEGTLELPDGRVGTILVTNLEWISGHGSFTGNGAPPGRPLTE